MIQTSCRSFQCIRQSVASHHRVDCALPNADERRCAPPDRRSARFHRYPWTMCNLYGSTKEEGVRKVWRPSNALTWGGGIVAPRKPGAFIRRARDDAGYSRELVVGRWGLIPWFSKTADIKFSTNNARSEELASKASFKDPWARGQRCIIPADWFDEPNWESGRNVWWRFHRVDGAPWGLAGLWGSWTDRSTGEVIESYTLLTINADHHPVMRRMHKAEVDEGRVGYLDRQSGRPAVPHGLRSTFRVWVAEETEYPREMAEMALAHTVGNEVERAYLRSDMVEKRRGMMEAWDRFLRSSLVEDVER